MHAKNRFIYNPRFPEAAQLTRLLSERIPSTLNSNSAGDKGKREIDSVYDYGKNRNKVLAFDYRGRRYVIKYFAKPSILERVKVFLGFSSKAFKSFKNAQRIISSGFETAAPIAAWDTFNNGILSGGAFLTDYVDGLCVGLIHVSDVPLDHRLEVARAFSDYTLRLHSAGLYPRDYNVGNVIVKKCGDNEISDLGYQFSIIDINRFRFGKIPNFRETMKSFDQLGVKDNLFQQVVVPYAMNRGWNPEDCRKAIEKSRKRNKFFKHIFHLFK